jgi:hypothetical protein
MKSDSVVKCERPGCHLENLDFISDFITLAKELVKKVVFPQK